MPESGLITFLSLSSVFCKKNSIALLSFSLPYSLELKMLRRGSIAIISGLKRSLITFLISSISSLLKDNCTLGVMIKLLAAIAFFTIIRTDRNMLLACYSHKHISYRIRTIIRKAIYSKVRYPVEVVANVLSYIHIQFQFADRKFS